MFTYEPKTDFASQLESGPNDALDEKQQSKLLKKQLREQAQAQREKELALIEFAGLPTNARRALEFWHERVGRALGEVVPGDAMTTTWQTWKVPKDENSEKPKKVSVKKPSKTPKVPKTPKIVETDFAGRELFSRRLGAGVNAVVLLDESDVVLVERLSESAAAVWRNAGFRVFEPNENFHLLGGVFNWLTSPARKGKCLVIKFGKAGSAPTLDLCMPPHSAWICEPEGPMCFDVSRVIKTRNMIAASSEEFKSSWGQYNRLLAERSRLISAIGISDVEQDINNINKKIEPLEKLAPPGLVLPAFGSSEGEILRISLIENPLDLS